jgi:hypothetical protein
MELLLGALSAILGFIAAFAAEPIKVYFENRSKKDQLRKALYGECASNYVRIKAALESFEKGSVSGKAVGAWVKWGTGLECYKYAKSEPVLYYQLKEAPTFNSLYIAWEFLNREQSLEAKNPEAQLVYCKNAVDATEFLIETGGLDKKLFSKMAGFQVATLLTATSEKRQKKSA